MSNPPPPPSRRSRAVPGQPPDDPLKRPASGDARHEPVEEPVYSLDDADETDDAIKEAMVREVVDHAARVTRAAELARPMESYRARPMVLTFLAIFSLAVASYAYAARPSWVFGPQQEHMPMEQRQAHVRYAMFLAAEAVLAFRDSAGGVLPRTLHQSGAAWPGMSYHPDAAEFTLRARVDSANVIEYRSTRDPRAFLGQATESLRERIP
jgi:hypothetical protein